MKILFDSETSEAYLTLNMQEQFNLEILLGDGISRLKLDENYSPTYSFQLQQLYKMLKIQISFLKQFKQRRNSSVK